MLSLYIDRQDIYREREREKAREKREGARETERERERGSERETRDRDRHRDRERGVHVYIISSSNVLQLNGAQLENCTWREFRIILLVGILVRGQGGLVGKIVKTQLTGGLEN